MGLQATTIGGKSDGKERGLMNMKYFPSVGTLHGTSLRQKALHLLQSAFLSSPGKPKRDYALSLGNLDAGE